MSPNYTDADAIEAYLGAAFTPEQSAAADAVAEAVTAYIDRYTGRSWQAISPVTGERRRLVPPAPGGAYPAAVAFLAHAPVVAVGAVSLRSSAPNASVTALAPEDYELVDPEHGVLMIADSSWWWCVDQLAVVDYTYADEAPPDIALAATMIASSEMARQLAIQSSSSSAGARPADLAGVKSLAVGQNDIAVTFADESSAASSGGGSVGSGYAPPGSAARTILDGYKRYVIA